MDTFISYWTSLWERISPISWWFNSSSSTPENSSTANQNQTAPSESSNKHDIPVTKSAQTLVSMVQEGSSLAQPTVNSHSVHPQIPSQYDPNYLTEIAKVDKINLFVKCAGKTMEVDMFPMESISVLLKEACERAGKKPEKMSLIFEGQHLDVNKTVHEYGLRGGSTVHLIHV